MSGRASSLDAAAVLSMAAGCVAPREEFLEPLDDDDAMVLAAPSPSRDARQTADQGSSLRIRVLRAGQEGADADKASLQAGLRTVPSFSPGQSPLSIPPTATGSGLASDPGSPSLLALAPAWTRGSSGASAGAVGAGRNARFLPDLGAIARARDAIVAHSGLAALARMWAAAAAAGALSMDDLVRQAS